jgi:hypothetical protein
VSVRPPRPSPRANRERRATEAHRAYLDEHEIGRTGPEGGGIVRYVVASAFPEVESAGASATLESGR